MALFKKGLETYDYTALQKRGLLKLPEQKKAANMTKDGYVDVGKIGDSENGQSQIAVSQQETSVNPFSFLDNLAGASQTQNSFAPSVAAEKSLEISGLKNKLEDLEYKIDRLLERIAAVEGRINSFEGNTEY